MRESPGKINKFIVKSPFHLSIKLSSQFMLIYIVICCKIFLSPWTITQSHRTDGKPFASSTWTLPLLCVPYFTTHTHTHAQKKEQVTRTEWDKCAEDDYHQPAYLWSRTRERVLPRGEKRRHLRPPRLSTGMLMGKQFSKMINGAYPFSWLWWAGEES